MAIRKDHNGQSQLDRKTLAKIHLAAGKIFACDEDYRTVLEAACGVRSCRDLTPEQVPALQRMFRGLGWDNYLLRRDEMPPLKYEALAHRKGMATPAQLRLIDALFNTLPGYGTVDAEAALCAFLRKRFRVEHPRFISARQCDPIIKALREMHARQGASHAE